MVVALLALSVAMGGTAYAAIVITGTNVKDGSLRSADIADGRYGVQGRDVKDGSLGSTDLSAAARASLKGNAGATGPTGAAGANGAAGLIGPQGIQGLSGTNGTNGTNGTSATNLWAVVSPFGPVIRGSGASSGAHLGAGSYSVLFNRDITGCAFQATVGSSDTNVPGEGYANTYVDVFPRRVDVLIRDNTGTLVDRPFHLTVFC